MKNQSSEIEMFNYGAARSGKKISVFIVFCPLKLLCYAQFIFLKLLLLASHPVAANLDQDIRCWA